MGLLNRMIRMRRFEEFVKELVEIHNEEMEDKTLWDIWLHRVFDKGYGEFRKSISENTEAAPTPEELKSTVMESQSILTGFVPDEGLERRGNLQNSRNDSD